MNDAEDSGRVYMEDGHVFLSQEELGDYREQKVREQNPQQGDY